jgi:AraC-like DNA-binding protein
LALFLFVFRLDYFTKIDWTGVIYFYLLLDCVFFALVKQNKTNGMFARKKIGGLDNLEVLRVENSALDFPAHYHETFCVSLIQKGVFSENGVIAPENSLLISNPMEVHCNPVLDGFDYSMVTFYIAPEVFEFAAGAESIGFSNKVVSDIGLFDLFSGLSIEIFDKSQKHDFEKRFLQSVQSLIGDYGQHRTIDHIGQPDWVLLIKEYISLNIEHKISLAYLALMVGQDKFQFMRKFKMHVGLSVFEYVMLQRVMKSKLMLKAGKPLVHTALDVGFYDQSNFTNYFKKFVGVTPRVYQGGL